MAFRFDIKVPTAVLFMDKSRLKATIRSAGSEIASIARSLIRSSTKTNKGAKTPEGAPPQSRSGDLLRGIKTKVYRNGERVVIKDIAYYARFLETGAVGGGPSGRNKDGKPSSVREMKPHPFLTTAFDQVEPTLSERITKSVDEGIKFKVTKK